VKDIFSCSSIGKNKLGETPALKLNIVSGSSRLNLKVSNMRFNYLFWHTNRGRYLQRLAIEI
jgi:hypothetical protein